MVYRGQTESGFRPGRSERGEGKLKALFVTAILILGVLVGVKVIPPYVAEYQLNDKIQEIARFGVVNHDSEDQIREKVFKTMEDLEIPATKDNIKVTAGTHAGDHFGGLHGAGGYLVLPRGPALHSQQRKQVAHLRAPAFTTPQTEPASEVPRRSGRPCRGCSPQTDPLHLICYRRLWTMPSK